MWSRGRASSWRAQGPGFDAQHDGEERKELHCTRTPSSVASISAHPHYPWDTKASWPFVHANSEVHVIHSCQRETLRLGFPLESMTGLTLKKKKITLSWFEFNSSPHGDTLGPQKGIQPELHVDPSEPQPSLCVSCCAVLGEVSPPLWIEEADEKNCKMLCQLRSALQI